MPELPEVETIRRDLEKEVVGRKVKSVEVTGMRAIRRHPNKKHFASKLEGEKLTSVSRKGKYLVMGVGDEHSMIIHLRMSGQLLRAAAKEPMPKHTHVVITFTQGGQLRFVDPRTFGEMFVVANERLEEDVPELNELGPDPIEQPVSWTAFAQRLITRKAKLKAVLLDQKFIAGLGNIYSDEILFAAGLRYDRGSDTLSSQEIRRLYRAVVETLHEAIKLRGSTLDDNGYLDLHGEPGRFQEQHQVYNREGEACRRCRNPIHKGKASGRSTFYCEQCQV